MGRTTKMIDPKDMTPEQIAAFNALTESDIRGNTGSRATGVLPYREARDEEDEKHLHPLQLDVIERACVLWSNPGETVLTPFMGVGSEICGALSNDRRAIGVELKPSYFRQAVKNVESIVANGLTDIPQESLFAEETEDRDDNEPEYQEAG